MKNIVVLPGPSSSILGRSIASCLNVEAVDVELKTFSDGESKIRINTDLYNKKCIVVQSTFPPVDSNFLQTFMMISCCKISGAAEVIPVIPYMGYARQDRSFLDGEVVTMSVISKLFDCFEIKNILTMDIHSIKALSHFKSNISNLTAIPQMAKYAINNLDLNKPIVVSPDQGGTERARLFADMIKSSSFGMRKTRDRNTGEIAIDNDLDLEVANCDIILLDDMISSGGTIMKAVEILKAHNCRRIFVMCVHALSDESSIDKLKKSGISELISTNSIPRSCSKIDLSSEISEKLKSILI